MLYINGRYNIILVIIIIDHIKTNLMAAMEMHLLGSEISFHFKQEQRANNQTGNESRELYGDNGLLLGSPVSFFYPPHSLYFSKYINF